MSIDAVVRQVSELLSRAHLLFAEAATADAGTAAASGAALAEAGRRLQAGTDHPGAASGQLVERYGRLAENAGAGLLALAASDDRLRRRVRAIAASHLRGCTASGAVIDDAVADAAAFAPLTQTPAGQQALLAALRTRLAQQQRIVTDAQSSATAAAAAVRSLTYAAVSGIPQG